MTDDEIRARAKLLESLLPNVSSLVTVRMACHIAENLCRDNLGISITDAIILISLALERGLLKHSPDPNAGSVEPA